MSKVIDPSIIKNNNVVVVDVNDDGFNTNNEKSRLVSNGTNDRTRNNINNDDDYTYYENQTTVQKCLSTITKNWRYILIGTIIIELVVGYHYRFLYKTSKLFKFIPGGLPGPYTKTQVLGFQIHTGGGPAIINRTSSTVVVSTNGSTTNMTNDEQIVTEINPECMQYGERFGLLGGIYNTDEPEFDCYLGLQDPFADVAKRLQVMQDAVEAALDVADNDPKTLKIFIAPEFFFRGLDGAYKWDDEKDDTINPTCGPICKILEGLEDIVADKRFEDWLFLFGSVIAYEDLPKDSTRDDFSYLFYNFAPIYRGYDPEKTNYYGKRYLFPKRYTSTLDFLTPQRIVNESFTQEVIGTDKVLPTINDTLDNPYDNWQAKYDIEVYKNYRDEIESLGYTMIEYGWIIMDDITMAIEICFDHFHGRTLETYMADAVSGKQVRIPKFSSSDDTLTFVPIPSHQAQIQLVSSSGMTINPAAMVVVDGATLFLQDGLYDDDADIDWLDEDTRISETTGGSEAITRTVSISPTDVDFHYEQYDVINKVSVYNSNTTETNGHPKYWRNAVDGVFSKALYEPMIVIWDTQDIVTV